MQVGKISLVFCFFHFVICFFARQTDRWIVHLLKCYNKVVTEVANKI